MYVIEDFQVEVKDLQMGATNRTSYEQMFPGGKGIKMAITKCRQTTDNILKMAEAAFPNKGIPQIEELTEGMCNVAYKLTYEDGFCTILKISSPTNTGFMTNECNLMDAEVKAMNLVASHTDIKVPQVYTYDTTKALCEGKYFFMECLDGENWITVIENLGEEVNRKLRKEVGKIQKQLTVITNDTFGLLGDSEHQFTMLYDFAYYLISNVLYDAERRNVFIGVSKDEILHLLEKDKTYFETVKTSTLVHWDMWEGNIFVKDEAIAGIIDWERAMWGEAYMDDRFRHHNRKDEFLQGFGVTQLSEMELRRIYWYDVLLYLTMMTEVTYREYEDDGQYKWAKSMFDEIWSLLK